MTSSTQPPTGIGGQRVRLRWAMVILALLAGLLVVGAAMLLARGNGNAPIQVLAPDWDRGLAPTPEAPRWGNGAASEIQVYVSGAATNPGVYTLRAGARLVDALAAAGGATAEADLAAVNLARRVRDEGHYHIPRVGEAPRAGAAADGEPGPSAAPDGLQQGNRPINLNTASVDLLVTLPGIGPARAKAIVDYRQRNGPFKSVDEIINVPGIGPSTYELIRTLVTVSGTP